MPDAYSPRLREATESALANRRFISLLITATRESLTRLHLGWYSCMYSCRLPRSWWYRISIATGFLVRLSHVPSQYGQMLFVFMARSLSSRNRFVHYSIQHRLFRLCRFDVIRLSESANAICQGVINFLFDNISERSVTHD